MTTSESRAGSTSDTEVQIVELRKQPVELYKILKFEGLVGSGGEAKAAIAGGHVIVNDEVETQKRKKIVAGDIIKFSGNTIRLQVAMLENAESMPQSTGPIIASKVETRNSTAQATNLQAGNMETDKKNSTKKIAKKKKPAVKKEAARKAISLRKRVSKNDK